MAAAETDSAGAAYGKGMVFGVFDRFHEGHRHFLAQAAARCRELIVVVTLDEVVKALKGRAPRQIWDERAEAIRSFNKEFKVVPGDTTLGAWEVITSHKPDIIFLGYDQNGIASELEKISRPFVFLAAHQPEKYKSSLLKD